MIGSRILRDYQSMKNSDRVDRWNEPRIPWSISDIMSILYEGRVLVIIFISGGVRSGKSTLGENLTEKLSEGRKVYLATAIVYDEEMIQRVIMHKKQRSGKGYITIEKSTDIGEILVDIRDGDTILLDCLGNLLANEMFSDKAMNKKENVAEKIFSDMCRISEKAENLIIISNDVFSDGCMYSDSVIRYIDTLAWLQRKIVTISDKAIECIAGISVIHKDIIVNER